MEKIFRQKKTLTLLLAGLGMVDIVLYLYCSDACLYLKGSLLGLDLEYLGILFMAAIVVSVLLKKDPLTFLMLSLGIGAELFLVGYQVVKNQYCPFCLAFGGLVALMFILNFDKQKIYLMFLSLTLGLLFFLFFFTGSLTPAFASDNLMTSYGSGPVEVRMYTDYFCVPCRLAEPKIEELLRTLMDQNVIRLTFIDTPMHKETSLYAKYFLYILNGNERSLAIALRARTLLYEGASKNIRTAGDLEAFLKDKGVKFKEFSTAAVFMSFEKLFREDGINSTPTCVIASFLKKEKLVGGNNIIKGLKGILKRPEEKRHNE